MSEKTLSIFIDESGRFQYPDSDSPFYILGMILHDQSQSIEKHVADLERLEEELGLEGQCFHAGPLIRKEKGYEILGRKFRARILSRMMAFAHHVDFRYHCLSVNKKFINSTDQIVTSLRNDLIAFLNSRHEELSRLDVVKVYYDCGQSPVTNLLHQTFENDVGCPVEFVQNVRPAKYRLFQLADLVCTLHLMELKIKNGIPLTCSENRFFGGPRDFQRNILKRIKRKEI